MQTNKPRSILDVAQMFQILQDKTSHEKLDKQQVQQLCFYAQGCYLAAFGEALFEDDFENGPFHFDTKCNEPCTDALLEHSTILNFVALVLFRFKNCDMPIYKQGEKQTTIPKANIQDHFCNMLHPLEKYIFQASTQPMNFAAMKRVVDKCKTKSEITMMDKLLNLWNFPQLFDHVNIESVPDCWPHQTSFQALASFLWFPCELEQEDDHLLYVILMEHVPYKLAFASKYKNPLAMIHMSHIFECEEEQDDGILAMEESNEYMDTCIECTNKRKRKEQQDFVPAKQRKTIDSAYFRQECTKYFENATKLSEGPFYQMGLVSHFLGDIIHARQLFQLGSASDERCKLRFALTEHNDKDARILLLSDIANPKALVGLGCCAYERSKDEAFTIFLQAAMQGEPDGWYKCGLMIAQGYEYHDKSLTSALLFENAGDCGIVHAYSKAASVASNYEKQLQLYKKQSDNGSLFGYLEQGKVYEKQGNLDAAIQCYQLARAMGIPDLRRLNKPLLAESLTIQAEAELHELIEIAC